jgi:polyribonucleotide nucleotidyltransferase
MEGLFKMGDVVKVKLIGIDHKTGKFKLSRKALMPKPENISKPQESNPPSQESGEERL